MPLHLSTALILVALIGCAAAEHDQVLPTRSLDQPAWVMATPFTSITAVRALSGGGVLVADFEDTRVVLVTASGQSVQTLGRAGSGPNEYTAPNRLIPLPGDSTLLLDRDAHRYLVIDPEGRFVATEQFPAMVDSGAQFMRGADEQGRLYFTVGFLSRSESTPSTLTVYRWARAGTRIDSVATILVANPKPIERVIPGVGTVIGRRLMPFTPQDDWAVAPSGRMALVRAEPYRLEWRELDGRITTGPVITYSAVPVTEADKARREPKGPPYQLEYPETKPAFREGMVVVDDRDGVYVRREVPASATEATWDLFDAKGEQVGTMLLPVEKRIVAVSVRFVYVVRTGDDGLQWLEAYGR